MRTTVVALLVPALVAVGAGSGCGPKSQLDPHASVIVTGKIQTEGGAASAATTVKLIRHPDALQAIGEVFVAVGSIGLACIAGRLDICSSFEDSVSGADGGYMFALRGADTQGSAGQALTFTAFAGCPGGNCAVASDFFIQRTALTIPPLRFWTETGGLVNDGNGDSQLSWPAVESSVGGGAADDYRVNVIALGGAVWWIQDAQRATTTKIDRRVTQDKPASWTVVAQRKDAGSGTDFTTSWYATQQAYPSHDLTPLSRAADCYPPGADGKPSLSARPCPITDGDPSTKFVPLPTPACPQGQTCPPVNNWIVVDNGFAHPLAFLVLYDVSVSNSAANVLVETSDDLMTWTIVATLPAKPYQTLTMPGAAARFVRLRLSDPMAQWSGAGNGEIALYAPF